MGFVLCQSIFKVFFRGYNDDEGMQISNLILNNLTGQFTDDKPSTS